MATWSTLQLTEFFSAISRAGDLAGAATCAAEQAAEATDAEIAVVVEGGQVLVGLGLGRGTGGEAFTTLGPAADRVAIGRLGDFWCSVQPMGEAYPGTLIVARADEAFAPEERQMLQGMARVLGLALRGLQTLAAERGLRIEQERSTTALAKRERLLETLLLIQRAATQRAPLQDVLDSVTRGAADFLDGAGIALVLRDDDATLIASVTAGYHAGQDVREAAGRAIRSSGVAGHGPLLAAPVYSSGEVAGSLVAGPSPATVGAQERGELLAAFAEQASLALTGAHTVAAVRQAYHDGLTGLPNRSLFLERLERALDAGTPVAVLYLDLDLFKQVNDTLGHAAGDELLRGVAGRLRECVRAGDMTARLGGDEFAILLEPADGESARAIAERVIAAVAAPFAIAGQDVITRASIGIALSGSGTSLIEDADVAMYRAKKSRPGTWMMFEPAMRTALVQQITLITDAERALANAEFELAYQPVVGLADGAPRAVEALLRWTHPALGPVPPATFVPLAEKNGFIVELGRWVLGEACRTFRGWQAAGLDGFGLSVNVSGRQLEDSRFAADVAGILARSGVPPSALTLEVTETALSGDPRQARRRILELGELGVRLSIDDFGAGFTSLAHLVEFPVDEIKIDKSFVDGIPQDRRRVAVLRSVLSLGTSLELHTVAEGVENAAQLPVLLALGCSAAQGFLFARPMPAPALAEYVADRAGDRVRTA